MMKFTLFSLLVVLGMFPCGNFQCESPLHKKEKSTISFVSIPGGTFLMGDHLNEGRVNERPAHKVTLSAFKLSAHEITNAQYCLFLNDIGNHTEGGGPWLDIKSPYCNIVEDRGTFISKPGKAMHPVIEVSWYGAKAFADWQNARLPTEAEWEYAARNGGKKAKFTSGANSLNGHANLKGIEGKDSWKGTSPIGSFLPNALGLYDMAGNVWEWCHDRYGSYEKQKQVDPKGPKGGSMRVVRGGSWSFDESYSSVTYRVRENAAYWSYDNGFRIAKDF